MRVGNHAESQPNLKFTSKKNSNSISSIARENNDILHIQELESYFYNLRNHLLFDTRKRKRQFAEPKFLDNSCFYLDTL